MCVYIYVYIYIHIYIHIYMYVCVYIIWIVFVFLPQTPNEGAFSRPPHPLVFGTTH